MTTESCPQKNATRSNVITDHLVARRQALQKKQQRHHFAGANFGDSLIPRADKAHLFIAKRHPRLATVAPPVREVVLPVVRDEPVEAVRVLAVVGARGHRQIRDGVELADVEPVLGGNLHKRRDHPLWRVVVWPAEPDGKHARQGAAAALPPWACLERAVLEKHRL